MSGGISLPSMSFWSGPISAAGLKPWWEIFRSYCLYMLYAMSLIMIYLTENFDAVRCTSRVKGIANLTASETFFVNSICYHQMDFRLTGVIALGGSTVLHFAYTFWELSPTVRNSFSPKPKRVHKSSKGYLRWWYLVRCAIALLFTLAGFALGIWFTVILFGSNSPTFDCTLDNKTAAFVGVAEFACSNHLQDQLIPFSVAMIIVLFIMGVCAGIGIGYGCNTETNRNDSSISDENFVKMFTKHSNPANKSEENATSQSVTEGTCLRASQKSRPQNRHFDH